MTRPLRLEYPGALWHVHNRGVEQRDIFLDDEDRLLFISLLAASIAEYHWILHAYVLMTNHFHLLIETPQTTLSRGMQRLEGDYAAAFNKRHDRVGHLFQGRFLGHLVEESTYFLTVCRYVVLNPVEARMVTRAGEWPWSSYNATAGVARPPEWLEISKVLACFHPYDRAAASRMYREFIAAGAGGVPDPFESAIAGVYLGSEAFIERIRELTAKTTWRPSHSKRQRREGSVSIECVRVIIEEESGVSIAVKSWRTERARLLFALLARSEAIASWPAIGTELRLSASGANKLSIRARRLHATDHDFAAEVDKLEIKISQYRRRV